MARFHCRVRNGSDRKGAGRVAFPPPKVGVTRTLPYPIRPHSGDCSVALAWANKEVEKFVCILGEEDVVYDVYVAAAAIDIRPTTKALCTAALHVRSSQAGSKDQDKGPRSSIVDPRGGSSSFRLLTIGGGQQRERV
ncbi:unnamed protein product [Boreogadus saida]